MATAQVSRIVVEGIEIRTEKLGGRDGRIFIRYDPRESTKFQSSPEFGELNVLRNAEVRRGIVWEDYPSVVLIKDQTGEGLFTRVLVDNGHGASVIQSADRKPDMLLIERAREAGIFTEEITLTTLRR